MKSSLRRKRRYSAAFGSPSRLTVRLSSYCGWRNQSIKRSRIARTPTRRLENTLSRTLLAGSGFVDEYSGDVFFGEWNDDAYGVLADGVMVGRIFNAAASPVGTPWMWTLAFGHHEDRIPTHGYEPTREAAMTAFAKSWRRD